MSQTKGDGKKLASVSDLPLRNEACFLSHPVYRKVTKQSSSQIDFNFLIMISTPMDGFRGKLLSNQNQPDWLKYEGDRLSKTPRNMAKLSVLVQRIRI